MHEAWSGLAFEGRLRPRIGRERPRVVPRRRDGTGGLSLTGKPLPRHSAEFKSLCHLMLSREKIPDHAIRLRRPFLVHTVTAGQQTNARAPEAMSGTLCVGD